MIATPLNVSTSLRGITTQQMNFSQTSACSTILSDSDSEQDKIILHVYDGESKEFTSLTTYHGMIRIYTSETWPSRIFWGVVVVTCVLLFMIQGGVLLQFYQTCPTAKKTIESVLLPEHLPFITICPYGFHNQDHFYEMIIRGDHRKSISKNYFNNSSKLIVEENSFSCRDVIEKMNIGRHYSLDFCATSRTQLTKRSACFTSGKWRTADSMFFGVVFKNTFSNMVTIHVHNNFELSVEANNYFWIDSTKQTKITIGIEDTRYYALQNGHLCNQNNYDVSEKHEQCIKKCFVDNFISSCQCNPFFDESSSVSCGLTHLQNCKKVKKLFCDCPSKCVMHTYVMKKTSTVPNKANRTHVLFGTDSNTLKEHQQYKRFRQIDLMSYVGGVMGLFLGMSCITLLEVFIYIVKTITGALNDSRHEQFSKKKFQSTDDYKLSHEEIVIIQKTEKRPTLCENYHPGDNGKTNYRKASTFSFFGTGQADVKMQLPRAHRKKSVYFGACDF